MGKNWDTLLKWIKKIKSEILNLEELNYEKIVEYLGKVQSLRKKIDYCVSLFKEKVLLIKEIQFSFKSLKAIQDFK